jgi:arsenate reductase-like glutaredoxin family protein
MPEKEIEKERIVRFNVGEGNTICKKIRVALYAQSDTLANSLFCVSQSLHSDEYFFFVPDHADEGAADFFRKRNIPFTVYSYSSLKKFNPSAVLLLNDWSKESQRVIAHCRWIKIPVICLQESIVDFGDKFKRMQHADLAFVQGAQTVNDLERTHYFITGNPRYEAMYNPIPSTTNRVFINCNFTYNIFENIRHQWLDDIVNVVSELGLNYLISQHPRDMANLSKYKNVERSSSEKVHAQIMNSKMVITRFSSLVHEALVLGKPVVYYNPHREKMKYNFGFNDIFLFLATNKDELKQKINKALEGDKNYLEKRKEYLAIHCLPVSVKPSEIIAKILRENNFTTRKFSFFDFVAVFLYYPSVKKILHHIRKFFR